MQRAILLAASLALVGCTTPAATPTSDTTARFERHMANCSARLGYDPAKSGDLQPHQLGENERAWNECVYEGVERYLAASSPVPDAYMALIVEHRQMTDQVEGGELSRQERRARVDAISDSIRRSEDALRTGAPKATAKQGGKATTKQELERLDRINRDLSRSRRSLISNL